VVQEQSGISCSAYYVKEVLEDQEKRHKLNVYSLGERERNQFICKQTVHAQWYLVVALTSKFGIIGIGHAQYNQIVED